jgi:hypothetical protein
VGQASRATETSRSPWPETAKIAHGPMGRDKGTELVASGLDDGRGTGDVILGVELEHAGLVAEVGNDRRPLTGSSGIDKAAAST